MGSGVVAAVVVATVVDGSAEATLGAAEIGVAVVDDDEVLEHAAITPSRATAIAAARLTWR
jgi:hypothetical protein